MKHKAFRHLPLLILPLLFACTPHPSETPSNSVPLSSEGSLPPTESSSETPTPSYVGTYIKTKHEVDGFDTVSDALYGVLVLGEDGRGSMEDVDAYGKVVQNGTYVLTEDGFSFTIGLKKYDFIYDESEKTLTYVGRVNRRDVTLVYSTLDFTRPATSGDRAFHSELFGESLAENFYNYAPTIMMEGNDVMHIWYCSNKVSKNVTDYIAYRKGTLQGDGKWNFSAKELVLEPTPGTWDERHTCDPSVIKGDFNAGGEHYKYLMAYLGCVTNDSSRNEVGVAVAKDPAGPWIKLDHLNPIANYYTSPEYVDDAWTWGYGQPSLVSVDKAGEILLFYTKGLATGTYVRVEHWDLSDLNAPVKLRGADVSNAGIVNANGGTDVINNADFAYDPFNNRLYVIKEDFPYVATENPTWITSTNTVQYLTLGAEDYVGETLFGTTNMRWQKVGVVGPSETGMARVHNTGLLTDEYGWITNPYRLPVIYTKSDLNADHPNWGASGQWPALHTYRLYGYLMEL